MEDRVFSYRMRTYTEEQLKRDPGLLKKIDAEIEKEQQEGAKPGKELTPREKHVKAMFEQRMKELGGEKK